jgi:Cu/Ag efflux protein CusF
MRKTLVAFAVLAAFPMVAAAQAPPAPAAAAKPGDPITQSASREVTATIEAIDHTNRRITLKDDKGNHETMTAGPAMKRFSELKVGDKVTFTYTESVAYKIAKPGTAAPAVETGTKVSRGTGEKPSGMVSETLTAVVTIKAIDPAGASVTVTTEDGETMSFKVENKDNLTGVAVGDKVQVTYTEAVAITVK